LGGTWTASNTKVVWSSSKSCFTVDNAGGKTMKMHTGVCRQIAVSTRGCGCARGFRRVHGKSGSVRDRVLRFLRDCDAGGALVEFGLVLPMLLGVVTGILAFGIAFNNELMLTNAVNQGALAVQSAGGLSTTTDPCNIAGQQIIAAAPNLISTGASGIQVTLTMNNGAASYGPTAAGSFTCTGGAASLVEGTNTTLSATYPCQVGVFGVNFASGCKLTAQSTELVQ
jgi:Flp pilus assembly protein TadG